MSLSHLHPSSNQITKLHSCYDSIECHLRSLEATGEDVSHCLFIALIFGNESSEVPIPINTSQTNQRSRPPQLRSTTGGLVAGNNSRGSSSCREFQAKCVYCNQSHWSDQCTNYPTLKMRKEKLKGSCYNCLQRGHTLKEYTKDRKGAHCGKSKNHHHSLCNQLFQQPVEMQNIIDVSNKEGTKYTVPTRS